MDGSLREVTHAFVVRGDLAHLALFCWASGTTGLLAWALRELGAANRRFNEVVQEIARFARRAPPAEPARPDPPAGRLN